MGRINKREMKKQINPIVKTLGSKAYAPALVQFNKAKRAELKEFQNNDISQEISDGNTAEHRVGILEYGNLFSFLGFEEKRKPVKELVKVLEGSIRLDKQVQTSERGDQILFSFPIQAPDIDEIYAATPSPAISSRSWVAEIEEGITGLSKYVFYKFFRGGRSKSGLQARKTARDDSSRPLKYVSELIDKLRGRFS